PGNTLVPALDHLLGAERKSERLAAVERAVEFGALLVVVVQPAGVMDADLVARGRLGAGAHGRVGIFEAVRQLGHFSRCSICRLISAHRVVFRRIAGRPATEVMRDALSEDGLARAVGIATLNALAELCWRRRAHPEVALLPGADAFDATEIHSDERVVLVGA